MGLGGIRSHKGAVNHRTHRARSDQQALHGLNSLYISRIMQWSQINHLCHFSFHLIINHNTTGKSLSTMHQTVTYSINFII